MPNFELEELPNVFNVLLTLTDQGKGYLLALSPEDFDYTGRSWPTADDIRQVQRRLSAGSGKRRAVVKSCSLCLPMLLNNLAFAIA